MKKIVGLVSFMSVFMVSALAFAAEGDTLLTKGVDFAFGIALPVVTAVALWLAHRLISVFETKTGIKVPLQEQLDGLITKGILLAEEKASAALRAKTQTITGPEKLEIAANFVIDSVGKAFPKLTKEAIADLILAKLPTMRKE